VCACVCVRVCACVCVCERERKSVRESDREREREQVITKALAEATGKLPREIKSDYEKLGFVLNPTGVPR